LAILHGRIAYDQLYARRVSGRRRERWISSAINLVNSVMPPSLRRGITLVLRRTNA
jgi:hypothetical protein